MSKVLVPFIVLTLMGGTTANAAEVSFVSGLYKSESNKQDGDKTIDQSTIEFGGRYGDYLSDNMHWFGQGLLSLKSYSGENAPSNSTGLTLRGGVRMYFNQFSETVLPFLSGSAGYRSDKSVSGNTESEDSGLYYWGDVGLRLEVDQDYFVEVESNLFESALWATEKTKPVSGDEQADTEKTRTELYVDTTGAFTTTLVGVGMRF